MQSSVFKGKKIILGVTGCIAAYKATLIIRSLIKLGAEVKVVMTPSATEFITPLTLSVLSHNNVIIHTFPGQQNTAQLSTWHIDLALWADLVLVAPCTVNTVSKIACGFADNALTSVVLARRSPMVISPAADVDMYEKPVIQENFAKLEKQGIFIIRADEGELASGLHGKGRLPEIDKILKACELVFLGCKKDLTGKDILVTAGPTYEDIDPVRFLGNRSSGKMGYEIAKAACLRGANVTLISGPSNEAAFDEVKLVNVRTADDMLLNVKKNLEANSYLIMAAAVADFKPAKAAPTKMKKENNFSEIKLTETEDILASIDKKGKKVIGFALETDNELSNAKKKLEKKNLDMIVLNSLQDKESGFEYDTNKITIIKKGNKAESFPLMTKFEAANIILTQLLNL